MALDEFRRYIEHKYKGREVISTKGETLVVNSIADLNFDNLEENDRHAACAQDWAWGITHVEGDEEVVKGILFRPVARDFLLCPKPYVALWGGFGSGKTLMGLLKVVLAIFAHPGLHAAVYRTTLSQVRNTTIKQLVDDLFPMLGLEEGVDWIDRSDPLKRWIEVYIGDEVSKIYYRPFKDQAVSIDKIMDDIKSFNVDMLLVDESVRLGQITHDTLAGRRGRWLKHRLPKEFHQLLLVGNPPDRHHYQYKMYCEGVNPRSGSTDRMKGADKYAAFWMSTYDNRDAVTAEYIQDLEEKPENWKRTFLFGEPGFVEHIGLAIYAQTFDTDRHVNFDGLKHDRNKPLLRGWDMNHNGHFKACVIAQMDEHGTLRVLDELVTDRPGIEPFVEDVYRTCNIYYPTMVPGQDYVDPAATEVSQVGMLSPTDLMAKHGFVAIPGDKHLNLRHNAVNTLLSNSPKAGHPGIIIDGTRCHMLLQGFQGGYKYKIRDESEMIISPQPDKNIYSHPHDALQYLCCKLSSKVDHKLREEQRMIVRDRHFRGDPQVISKERRKGRYSNQPSRFNVPQARQFI